MDPKWARRALVGLLTAALLVGVSSGVAAAAPVAPDQSESSPSGQSGSGSGSRSDQAGSSSAQAQAEQARARAAAAVAAQRAARAQQRAAEAAQRGRASWESHSRPHKMIIVRPTSVDSLTEGAISRRTPRTGGVITLASLDALVPSGWITASNGTAQLAAAVVLTPGVTLDIGGAGLTTLQLLGGPTAADAAAVYTGSGRLNVHGVTVTSLDPASGQPVAPGPGRPFVYMAAGGRLDATDATFSDLGTPATEPHDRAGVSFGAGSTGSLVRTTVLRNSTGVRLRETTGVRLEGLTVAESASDGLMLQGDQGTTLIGVRAERNTENGVQVSGPSSTRPITGISTSGNGKYGLAVVSQDAPQITNIVTQADGVGGLQLSGDSSPVVSNFSAVDQPIGVLTHVSSTKVTLGQLRISGGGRGVVVEKTTDGLALTGSTIERTQTGISIGGKHIELRDVLVGDSRSGVRVERGAGGITATALNVTGGQDGIVLVPGTSDVVLRDLVIDGVGNNGVRTSSPNAQILGGRISNSTTGIDAEAATTINGTEITAVNVGIRARSADLVAADDVSVSAMTSGINVADGSPFVLADSRVDALEAVSGQAQYQGLNTLSLPPLNVLGVIGIPLVLLALLLDQVQRFRERQRGISDGRRLPPPRLQAGTH
jgi:Right handed beta helix region